MAQYNQKDTVKNLESIKKSLIFLCIPVVFWLLMVLKFIFIPLFGAIFVSLLFMPLVRKMKNKNIPSWLSIGTCISIIVAFLILITMVIKLSSAEFFNADPAFIEQAEQRFEEITQAFGEFMAGDAAENVDAEGAIDIKGKMSQFAVENGGPFVSGTLANISRFLMFLFFLVLLLSDTIDMQKMMQTFIFKKKLPSIRTFMKIEKSIVKFIWVKFLLSFFTGVGFTIVCYAYGVSFPIFWGFFTFAINFVQMIGSIIAVIVVTVFGVVEIHSPGSLLGFALFLTLVQVIFGGILEPILMGKSFSINTITVLIMLALWGFVWGIPGLIMSVPITVLAKTILEQMPHTKKYAQIMS